MTDAASMGALVETMEAQRRCADDNTYYATTSRGVVVHQWKPTWDTNNRRSRSPIQHSRSTERGFRSSTESESLIIADSRKTAMKLESFRKEMQDWKATVASDNVPQPPEQMSTQSRKKAAWGGANQRAVLRSQSPPVIRASVEAINSSTRTSRAVTPQEVRTQSHLKAVWGAANKCAVRRSQSVPKWAHMESSAGPRAELFGGPFRGQDKWLGGEMGPNGDIYGIPGTCHIPA